MKLMFYSYPLNWNPITGPVNTFHAVNMSSDLDPQILTFPLSDLADNPKTESETEAYNSRSGSPSKFYYLVEDVSSWLCLLD